MDRQVMEARAGELLALRDKLARLHLSLPPNLRMELVSLENRLGWSTMVPMSRRKPRRYSTKYNPDWQFVDNPQLGTGVETLQLQQKLRERHAQEADRMQAHLDAGLKSGVPEDHPSVVELRSLIAKRRSLAEGKPVRESRTGRPRRYSEQQDEDSFHAALDAHPDDHTTRMVFADWLQERGDPRAEGYRALGVQGRRPDFNQSEGFYSSEAAARNYNGGKGLFHPNSVLPDDWYKVTKIDRNTPQSYSHHWKYFPHRRAAEDAAAHAFARLPPERRAELLNPHKLRRRGQVRFAKAEKDRHPAHPLIAGFPLEHALRHMANDASRSDSVRELSKRALTTGDTSALWGLNDAVQEDGKGVPGGYNLMSAADKVGLDAHTHTAAREFAENHRKRFPGVAGQSYYEHTPEYHVREASHALKPYPPNVSRPSQHSTEALAAIRARVKELSPYSTDKDIDESIRRHSHRATELRHRDFGVDASRSEGRAITAPDSDPLVTESSRANEKATRYRRRTGVVRHGRGQPEPQDAAHYWIDPDGTAHDIGQMFHHKWMLKNRDVEQEPAMDAGWQKATATPGENVLRLYGHKPLTDRQRNAAGEIALRHRTYETTHKIKGQPKELPVKLSRKRVVVRYDKSNVHNHIDALRIAGSSNYQGLEDAAYSVGRRMGINNMKAYRAIHVGPNGSIPGVSQAVYGQVPPEKVHGYASFVNGLLPNAPGYGVFHTRASGPDTLYKISHNGSEADAINRLKRSGIQSFTIVHTGDPNSPHRNFDVLIPDKGNRLTKNVEQYAAHHGLSVEASPGHFQTVGGRDQAASRATFRDKVVAGEKTNMSRTNPRRFSLPPDGDLRGGAVRMEPRTGQEWDHNNLIRSGLEQSRRQLRGDIDEQGLITNREYEQDVHAGKMLADILDENGMPHAPFFRSLIRGTDAGKYVHDTGTYQEFGNNPHQMRQHGTEVDGTQWQVRPAGTDGRVTVALVRRYGAGDVAPTHVAVMDAPALREWNKKLSPSLRARLNLGDVAGYLETHAAAPPTAHPDAIDHNATKLSRRQGQVHRYAKVPQPEHGRLTPDQLAIAMRARESGDPIDWRVLGDHLQENGFPNTGEVISRAAEGDGSDWDSRPLRHPREFPQFVHGSFSHSMIRDDNGPSRIVMLRLGNSIHRFMMPVARQMSRSRRRALQFL